MSDSKKITAKQQILIDGWIRLMEMSGLSYDEMLSVLDMARQKLLAKKEPKKQCMDEHLQPIECNKYKGCNSCPYYINVTN